MEEPDKQVPPDPNISYDTSSHDKYECGLCMKTYHELLDFLYHKSLHAGPGKGIMCEICKLSYSRQKALVEHYRQKHKIELIPKVIIQHKPSHRKKNKTVREKIILDHQAKEKNSQYIELHDGIALQTDRVNILDPSLREKSDLQNSNSETPEIQDGISGNHLMSSSTNEIQTALSKENLNLVSNQGLLQNEIVLPVTEIEGREIVMNVNASGMPLPYVTGLPYLENQGPVEKENQTMEENSIKDHSKQINTPDKTFSLMKETHLQPISNVDFHFVLKTNIIHGNSITYGKHIFKCLHCEFKTYTRTSLVGHMKSKHSDFFNLHQQIEVKQDPANSQQKVMKMSEYVSKHAEQARQKRVQGLEKGDQIGSFPCSMCNKVFSRLRYLQKHVNLHKASRKFLCDDCGKEFKTRMYLNAHLKTHKQKEAFKCSQCDFTSTVNAAIHAHRQLHNEGSVLCDICGYAYNDKSTLAKHKKVHDASRPFSCTYPGCTWRFKTEVLCRAHYRAHTTEGKFRCEVCGYVFRHKHHLQRHESKIHNTKPDNSKTDSTSKVNGEENAHPDLNPVTTDTVNLIINDGSGVIVNTENPDDLDLHTALNSSQLVITTDEDGNTINYEVADIAMNVAYQALLQGPDGQAGDTHTILIPQTDGSHIVFQHEEIAEAVGAE